jgi:hypothetical protein
MKTSPAIRPQRTYPGKMLLVEVCDAFGLDITLTGNKAGTALKTFSVAASLTNSTLHVLDGNVGVFTVGRQLLSSTLVADATSAGGRFTTLSVGRWINSDFDAKSVGTLKVIGNATAGEMGDLVDSAFTLRGNLAGVGLGTFSASGIVDTTDLLLRNGSITSFTASRGIQDSNIILRAAALGNLKMASAASWINTDLTARTVGTLKVTGAAQVGPASSLLPARFDRRYYQNPAPLALAIAPSHSSRRRRRSVPPIPIASLSTAVPSSPPISARSP